MSFSSLLDLVALSSNQVQDYREILSRHPYVQIFGAGQNGLSALRCIESNGGSVIQFVDNDLEKEVSRVEGLNVTGAEGLREGIPIVIASSWGKEIAQQLLALGRTDYFDFSFCFDSMYRSHFELDSIRDNAELLLEFYSALEDEASRTAWIGIMRYRLTLNPLHLNISNYPQYFSPYVPILPGDLIIDGGAWIGDTAKAFLESVQGQCQVIAFEPAAPNYARLISEQANLISRGRIIPVQKGLWYEGTTLRINTEYDNTGRSKIEDIGTDIIDLVRLDDYLADDQQPSVIKFDLEGAELRALKGALETIRRYHPRLMLSIYHHGSDFWNIFREVREVNPGYRFSLGHHSASMFETVLYAR